MAEQRRGVGRAGSHAAGTRARRRVAPRWLLALVGVLTLLLVFLVQSQPAHAASITVNTFVDELNVNGNCSLREAIQAANTDTAVDACPAGSGADTIVVPAGTYTLSIAGAGEDANATGDLDISAGLTINGAGAATTIIDATGLGDRVFHVLAGIVTISGVTIKGGNIAAGGGGIFNTATLTVNNSTVSGNTTTAGGGGILNGGTLTVNNSTISGGSASNGGGIYNSGGTVTLNNSTVNGNTTAIFGGSGGGISNVSGTVTVNNSTVSGNMSGGNPGGGIANFSAGISTLILNSSTVNGNSGVGGINVWTGASATIKNTIVANTSGGNCSGAGTLTSLGHNLSSDATCAFAGTGDLNSTGPLLGPLANNGGPTQTHALLPGSPAIDAVPLASCTFSADQRGVARPQGAACDIGAYERAPAVGGPAVGGIAEAPDLTALPERAPGASRPPAAAYAVATSVIAALFVTAIVLRTRARRRTDTDVR